MSSGKVVYGRRKIKTTKQTTTTKSAKSKTKVDKRQDLQLKRLRKLVVGQKELVEARYVVNKNTLPIFGYVDSLINYDNTINGLTSTMDSRTFFRISSNLLIQGNSGGQGSTTDSARVIRVLYFMYKCDIIPGGNVGAATPSVVIQPTVNELFDDVSNVNDAMSIQRTSYKNRDRIRILKDRKLFITNHGNGDDDIKTLSFNKNYKYGFTVKRYVNDDSFGSKKVWLPFVCVLDGAGSNNNIDNAYYTIVNQVLYNEED